MDSGKKAIDKGKRVMTDEQVLEEMAANKRRARGIPDGLRRLQPERGVTDGNRDVQTNIPEYDPIYRGPPPSELHFEIADEGRALHPRPAVQPEINYFDEFVEFYQIPAVVKEIQDIRESFRDGENGMYRCSVRFGRYVNYRIYFVCILCKNIVYRRTNGDYKCKWCGVNGIIYHMCTIRIMVVDKNGIATINLFPRDVCYLLSMSYKAVYTTLTSGIDIEDLFRHLEDSNMTVLLTGMKADGAMAWVVVRVVMDEHDQTKKFLKHFESWDGLKMP